MASPEQSALDAAVTQAKQQWPRLANWNVRLSTNPNYKGRDWSETWNPEDTDNPTPGSWHIELRNPKALSDPLQWPQTIALESLHWLQATDPTYQNYTEQFIRSMTPQQHAMARQAYTRGLVEMQAVPEDPRGIWSPDSNVTSYDKFLRQVQAQEFIRGGGMFPLSDWTRDNYGGYTSQQRQLLQQITNYLQTPSQNDSTYMLNRLINRGG